ncbi:hypothetical protein Cs7R123_54240 [Catellatospora sp. TT07R-123]|uniref:MauE/DoxX family redox-associated membrane protein n=1 Tax=Catellatospora sp. TT07R-123 TaxID=2733863 RepID=UPI001B184AEF|nr:MauE/DoxX family redox-associated membrane protein [Catellatospora sp. TT07R-123]GHJ48082.1 hypothetical protein Cs7R123_54240 [Catellatospora sp. TT07R-123]
MLSWISAVQPLLLAAVLLWSARLKLAHPQAEATARRTALAKLLGETRVVPAFRALGAVEAAVAVALLVPAARPLSGYAAVALTAGFAGYLGYAKVAAPESSCGCLSAARTPVRWRAFARAGLLIAAGVLAATATTGWIGALADNPGPAAAVLVAEAAAVLALSAELDRHWLDHLRQLRVRLTHPLPTGGFDIPLASTVEQLHRSPVWRDTAALLTSDLREHWDEGDWRLLLFTGRHGERGVSAVFAVPRLRYEPASVRLALVDEATGETVATHTAAPDTPLPDWVHGREPVPA